MIPSPRVGSGVDVLQTMETNSQSCERHIKLRLTLDILERKNAKPVELSSVGSYRQIESYSRPRPNGPTVRGWPVFFISE